MEELWDACVSLGKRVEEASRVMGHHGRGQHPCLLCDSSLNSSQITFDHHKGDLNHDQN